MIFNVSDLWPESAEKLEIINNKAMLINGNKSWKSSAIVSQH